MLVINVKLPNFSNRVISNIIISLERVFSKIYKGHYEMISNFNVGLKSLLHQVLSDPAFYGDLVNKFKKIMDMTDLSDQFRKKIIIRHKRIGYDINAMR